jgi:hypothetical protein
MEKLIVKIGWAVIAVLVCIGIYGVMSRKILNVASPNATSPAPAFVTPVWEWTLVKTDTMVLPAGAGVVGYDIPQGYATPQKVVLSAKAPITAAYISAEYRQAMVSNPLETRKLQIFHCLQQQILQTTLQCRLPADSGYALVVYDERTAGQALVAGLGAAVGIKGPAEQALAKNDVTIQVYRWQCVRNCYVPIEQHGHLPEPG